MCNFPNAYVNETPKKVGDILDASTYAFNNDGSILTTSVLLKGYNQANGEWKTFTSTIPRSSDGWAGMPMIAFTTDYIGTWTLNFGATDKNGDTCNVGPFILTINPTDIKMTLQSDKMSITSGDSVSFNGTYLPNSSINIFIEDTIRTHLKQITSDQYGNFNTDIILTSNTQKTVQIGACTAGGLYIYECSILPDKSNYLYITIYPQLSLKWKCSGSPNYTCTQETDGTFNTLTDCQNSCASTTEITQCWSMKSWFEQVAISNIKSSKVVSKNSTFKVETTIIDYSTIGCLLGDRYFKVQIKSLTKNKYIWESLRFKLCKDESIIVPADLLMENSDEILNIQVCHEKTTAPNTLQDNREIRVEVATLTKPPTDPENTLPPVKEPSSGLCGMIGLSDQECTYLTYGALAIGGLLLYKTIRDSTK